MSEPAPAAAGDAILKVANIETSYGPIMAIRGVTLAVPRGKIVVVLGANGAGKTTAIRLLCGTLPASGGEMHVGGVDMMRHPQRARGRIGYVAQRFALYDDLQVEENLRLQAGLYGLTGTRKRERIAWALEHLSLGEQRRIPAGQLPLGYKRRLALAAALLHQPQVLFLDEPTSGVDPIARQQFWDLIYDLADTGIGILVTTHYMDEALFCDRLALMDRGRIITKDTPQALLQRPLATPIIELRSSHCIEYARELAQWPEVQEIIPHAGQLRVRLRAGHPPQTVMDKISADMKTRAIDLEGLRVVLPELEDVFVSLLEQAGETL